MAKGGRKVQARQKRIEAMPPTPEQEKLGEYRLEPITERGQLVGTAYRKRPMIDILHERGIFTDGQHRALKHYRHHADLADKSPIRDSLTNWMPKSSNGHGPGVELLNAVKVTSDCERAAGALAGMLRAVVVDDMSLSRWAMLQHGAREHCKTNGALTICTMAPTTRALRIVTLEIRAVACRVQGELDA